LSAEKHSKSILKLMMVRHSFILFLSLISFTILISGNQDLSDINAALSKNAQRLHSLEALKLYAERFKVKEFNDQAVHEVARILQATQPPLEQPPHSEDDVKPFNLLQEV